VIHDDTGLLDRIVGIRRAGCSGKIAKRVTLEGVKSATVDSLIRDGVGIP
jgi:hypothetical protein